MNAGDALKNNNTHNKTKTKIPVTCGMLSTLEKPTVSITDLHHPEFPYWLQEGLSPVLGAQGVQRPKKGFSKNSTMWQPAESVQMTSVFSFEFFFTEN